MTQPCVAASSAAGTGPFFQSLKKIFPSLAPAGAHPHQCCSNANSAIRAFATLVEHALPGEASMQDLFRKFAVVGAEAVGSPWAFMLALLGIVFWAWSGPLFHFSDTWQLVVNTGTTIITFLMVFLIQNTQNRDARVLQLKLDELIRAVEGARTGMVRLEDLSDADIARLQAEFEQIRTRQQSKGVVGIDAADI
jgi:low affinity Fe/Cu permease